MYSAFISPFLSPFIPENFHHVILQSCNFKSELATYIKKLKCIFLQVDFEPLHVSKNHSQYTGVCVCVYGCAYTVRLCFEFVCINYGMISSLCTENTFVLTVTSLLRKTSGNSWICWRQWYERLNSLRFYRTSIATVRDVTFTQNDVTISDTLCFILNVTTKSFNMRFHALFLIFTLRK